MIVIHYHDSWSIVVITIVLFIINVIVVDLMFELVFVIREVLFYAIVETKLAG